MLSSLSWPLSPKSKTTGTGLRDRFFATEAHCIRSSQAASAEPWHLLFQTSVPVGVHFGLSSALSPSSFTKFRYCRRAFDAEKNGYSCVNDDFLLFPFSLSKIYPFPLEICWCSTYLLLKVSFLLRFPIHFVCCLF